MPQRYDITEESSLYDLLLYAYGVDDEDAALTADQRREILGELTDLDRVTSNYVKSRDRIAADRKLEEFKAEQKQIGDQRAFERDMAKLKASQGDERLRQLRQLSVDLQGKEAQYKKRNQPDVALVTKVVTGSKTLEEQLQRMAGDPILQQYRGVPGSDAKIYANLKYFGTKYKLFDLEGGKVIPGPKLRKLDPNSAALQQLQTMVGRTFSAWQANEKVVESSAAMKEKFLAAAEDPTLELDDKALDQIIKDSRAAMTVSFDQEEKIAEDIQTITEALAEDDKYLANLEEDRQRLIAELERSPKDKVKSAYAKAVANPNFRLWAESNGFDIGTSKGTAESYEPGSDDERAILTFGLQAKSGLRLAPRTGRTVEYNGEVYIEERLTPLDIERGKRRLFDSEKQETIEIPLDEPIKVMDPIRIPVGQRIQMKRNQMVDARRDKRSREKFLGDDDMSDAEKLLMREQLELEEDIEARQARVARLLDPLEDDALVVAGDDDDLYFRDKDGNIKVVNARGVVIDVDDAEDIAIFEQVEQNRDLPGVQEFIRTPQDIRDAVADSDPVQLEKGRLAADQQRTTDVVEERARMRGKFLPTPETTLRTSEELEKSAPERARLARTIGRLDTQIKRAEDFLGSEFGTERQRKAYEARLERLTKRRDRAQERLSAFDEPLPDMPVTPKPVEVGESIPSGDVLPAIPFSEGKYNYVYDPNSRQFKYKSPSSGKVVTVTSESNATAFDALMGELKKQKPDARLEPARIPGASTAEATEGTVIKPEALLDKDTPVAGLGAAMEAGRQAQDAGVGISDTVLETARDLGEAGRTGTPLPGGSYYDKLMQVQRQLKGTQSRADRAARKYDRLKRKERRAVSRAGDEPSARVERLGSRTDKAEQNLGNLLYQVRALRDARDELSEMQSEKVKLREKKKAPKPPPGEMTLVSEGMEVEEKGVSNGAQ